jgi:hypothetical protein
VLLDRLSRHAASMALQADRLVMGSEGGRIYVFEFSAEV